LLWQVLAVTPGLAADPVVLPAPVTPSRVLIVQDARATEAFEPRPQVVLAMVNRAMTNLTSKPTPEAAWRSLISTQDVVGLKVYAAPGPRSGTRPAVAAAIVQGLLKAGLPASNIVVWDKQQEDLVRAGYMALAARHGIQIESSAAAGYDEKVFYEAAFVGQLVEGDLEFGRTGENVGRRSFVSKLLTHRITKIINVSPLLNHYRAGVTGNLFSLATGSVDNVRRFEFSPSALGQAVPEIYAMKEIGDRVVLSVVDALICQYEGENVSFLQYASVLNELRFSTDPVALDTLSLIELERQRKSTSKTFAIANILQNAAIMDIGVNDPAQIRIEQMR